MTPLLEHLETALAESREIPLWGSPPPFPWENFSQHLSKALHLPHLSISSQQTAWIPADRLSEGLGAQVIVVPLECAPLKGKCFWMMSAQDVALLISRTLTENGQARGLSDPRLQEGYYHYLLAQMLQQWQDLQALSGLTPKIGASASPPHQNALCMDVKIAWSGHSCWGRLVCPPAFHHSLKAHFAQARPSLQQLHLTTETPLLLRLEAGRVTLPLDAWEKIKTGDCLLLDQCSYDPKTQKGSVEMVVAKQPLFRVRIKSQQLKILDYAFYYEEGKTMEEQEPPSPEESEPLWTASPAPDTSTEEMLSAHAIPVTLVVEVARLQMTIEKLLQLQPGNVIELPIQPENGVDLTVNGKRIARGELVKLGEAIGVKILQRR